MATPRHCAIALHEFFSEERCPKRCCDPPVERPRWSGRTFAEVPDSESHAERWERWLRRHDGDARAALGAIVAHIDEGGAK